MYTIFINKGRIVLTEKPPKIDSKKERCFYIEEVRIKKILKKLDKDKLNVVYLVGKKKEKILKKFKDRVNTVKASGGLVKNKKGKYLFIYRNNKWDLPKGKLDKKETIEQAAIREVEEETGVSSLVLGDFIICTYHIFKRNNIFLLKETFWYHMTTEKNDVLVPQVEENITQAIWKDVSEVPELLKKSYKNIKLVCDFI